MNFWQLLNKRGASKFSEQKALIKPVLRLLKNYELVIIGDREFHSVKLAYWLQQKGKKQQIFFAFRQKQGTNHQQDDEDYQTFSQLGMKPGMKRFLTGVSVTKGKGKRHFNVGDMVKENIRENKRKNPGLS